MNYRRKIKLKFLSWLLPRLLSKKCPIAIPTSGEEGRKVDCYVIYIRNLDGELSCVVDGFDIENIELSVQNINSEDKTFSISATIQLTEVLNKIIEVRHYFKGYIIRYNSLSELIIKYLTRYEVAKCKYHLLWDRHSQFRFNKGSLVTPNRIELLGFLLNYELDQYNSQPLKTFITRFEGLSIWDIMTKIHTERWFNHPYSERQLKELELYLDSLIQTGDLTNDRNGKYFIVAQALNTLENYEQNKRRHQDNVNTQKLIACLTLIIALATIFK